MIGQGLKRNPIGIRVLWTQSDYELLSITPQKKFIFLFSRGSGAGRGIGSSEFT